MRTGGWRGYKPFTVVEKEVESEGVTSFYMKPADGAEMPEFKPGQYITIKVTNESDCAGAKDHDLQRNYSVSSAPGRDRLRVSVKRQGTVSCYLHDVISVGDELMLGVPCGVFTMNPTKLAEADRPLVFIGAGVGITPLMGMMGSCLDIGHMDGAKMTFVQCCRGSHEHPMRGEMEQAKERGVR